MICADVLARPAKCGTPVPQPLSVMNSIKAKSVKSFVAGEGVMTFGIHVYK